METQPDETAVCWIIKECGSKGAAIRYCEKLASHSGPLAQWYSLAAEMIRKLA